ncbi:DUF6241 domain-containing protein [Alkalihalobacterium bogoriense]|uniref:DUF6241 domain-containing protein n=1 Tax=Alkalihalobacterium bogoriense TaxID=246272 RepID=UPI0006858658|nr:DUF6241 domain-containing protein [Alkalihalobacterium bogoriense]
MKNNKLIKFAAIVAVISIVVIGYFSYQFLHSLKSSPVNDDLEIGEEEVDESELDADIPVVVHVVPSDDVEELFPFSMTEDDVQKKIHYMSHQKVRAEHKWNNLQITQERIERLLEVVEHNKDKYTHYELYNDILVRWKNGDFSKADKDHNSVWELQGGTIGKAVGLLTAEEEQEFIDKNFNKEEKEDN